MKPRLSVDEWRAVVSGVSTALGGVHVELELRTFRSRHRYAYLVMRPGGPHGRKRRKYLGRVLEQADDSLQKLWDDVVLPSPTDFALPSREDWPVLDWEDG